MCTKNFLAKDNRTYQIDISESGEVITVSLRGEPKGSISLTYCEGVGHGDDHYYITNLSLDKCKKEGIGTACLKYHKKIFGRPILAASDDGIKKDDGSHLTGDGPAFIATMRDRKIVCPEPPEHDNDNDDYYD